ncbi:MAG: ankyrin repeat domain-containing protein [Vulcanimicrobiota bacterium]
MQGQCFCGAIRYRLLPPTDFAGHCHCQSCRSATGAPMVSWTSVANEQFELLEGQERLRIYPSSARVAWEFCSRCGTTLFYHSSDTPERTYVTVASLREPLDRELESHVSCEEMPGWFQWELPRFFAKTDLPIDSLHQAASAGDLAKVRQLVALGMPLDGEVDGTTPLMRAARQAHLSVCRFLLKRGARAELAVDSACVARKPETPALLRLLLDYGCEAQKMLPLVAQWSTTESARVVLRAAADLDLPADDGEFPLYKAVKNSNAMVRLFLAQGVEPLLLNRDGSHPLHYCACWGHTNRLRALLEAGVPADYLEEPPMTALDYACANGHYDCAKALLQAGADPQAALFRAADYGSLSVVELLLAFGADREQRDEQGRAPRDYALDWLPDLLSRLRERMAQYGRVRHRWHLNERGERVLHVKAKGAEDTRADGHAQIAARLS